MNAVIERRCFNTEEAIAYLGIKRRAFDQHIAPRCSGVKIGTSKMWERAELDAAWEQYKIDAGNERPAEYGGKQWDAKRPASMKQSPDMKLIKFTKENAFENAASAILKKQKHG